MRKSDRRALAFSRLYAFAAELQMYDSGSPERLRFTLRMLEEAMGHPHSRILALHSDSGALHLITGRGRYARTQPHAIAIGQGIVGISVQRDKTIRINNIGSIFRYSQAIMERMSVSRPMPSAADTPHAGMQSQLVVPIKLRGEPIGALSVESELPNAFDEVDEELLTIVAALVAPIVHELRAAQTVMEAADRPVQAAAAPGGSGTDPELERLIAAGPLSPRELEVAHLAAKGLSNADIAAQLFVSQRTVSTHLERVYRKLDIHSRSALIRYFMASGSI